MQKWLRLKNLDFALNKDGEIKEIKSSLRYNLVNESRHFFFF